MTRSFPPDPRPWGVGCPHGDYFVEWQISDEPGTFIDLVTDASEAEMRLEGEGQVTTTSGR